MRIIEWLSETKLEARMPSAEVLLDQLHEMGPGGNTAHALGAMAREAACLHGVL